MNAEKRAPPAGQIKTEEELTTQTQRTQRKAKKREESF
jgi:hypothetical protein